MNTCPRWEQFRSGLNCPRAVCVVAVVLFLAGIWLRQLAWSETGELRFTKDIINGFYWGGEVVAEGRTLPENAASPDSWVSFFRGYLALYDQVKEDYDDDNFHLDYPPLRLLVMSVWTKHELSLHPGADVGVPEYVKPLLLFNVLCEVATAVGIFLLVRHWTGQGGGGTSARWLRGMAPEERGWICGLAAASVAWIEPSLMLDAHAWPQWDVWCLPFFVFAALSASTGRWLCCGCLLALGAMFKGQLLMVAPFFVMWPAVEKEWRRAMRVLAGFSATVAVIVSPWVVHGTAARFGLTGAVAAFAVFLATRKWTDRRMWLCVFFAAATVIACIVSHGSTAWAEIGFMYGTEQYPYLIMGSCYNLPALLDYAGFSLKDPLWSHDFGTVELAVNLQWILRLFYIGALWLCARGTARLARNRDARMLIALATPWLLMFVLLGQMHERYLMWGAIVSAAAFGTNARLSLVHFLFSTASTMMIVHVMLIDKHIATTLPAIHFLDKATPWVSSMVIIGVCSYLWECVRRHDGEAGDAGEKRSLDNTP